MHNKIIIPIFSLGLMALAACSSEPDEAQSSEHVWTGQTQAIDKAREVEGMLQRSKQSRENPETQ